MASSPKVLNLLFVYLLVADDQEEALRHQQLLSAYSVVVALVGALLLAPSTQVCLTNFLRKTLSGAERQRE